MADNDQTEPAASGWHVRIDLRDVLAGVGVVVTAGGAWFIHPGLAVMAAGLGIIGLAVWLVRR